MDLAVSSRMKNVKTYKQKPLESYQRLNGLTYFEWLILEKPRLSCLTERCKRASGSGIEIHSEEDQDIVGICRLSLRTCLSSAFWGKTSFTVYRYQSYFLLVFLQPQWPWGNGGVWASVEGSSMRS